MCMCVIPFIAQIQAPEKQLIESERSPPSTDDYHAILTGLKGANLGSGERHLPLSFHFMLR